MIMKKNYEKPVAEKIEFDYKEQIVTSGGSCDSFWTKAASYNCTEVNTGYNLAH